MRIEAYFRQIDSTLARCLRISLKTMLCLDRNHPLMTNGIARRGNVDLNIAVEPIEEDKQPFDAETVEVPIFQSRDVRLIDAEEVPSLSLREVALFKDSQNGK